MNFQSLLVSVSFHGPGRGLVRKSRFFAILRSRRHGCIRVAQTAIAAPDTRSIAFFSRPCPSRPDSDSTWPALHPPDPSRAAEARIFLLLDFDPAPAGVCSVVRARASAFGANSAPNSALKFAELHRRQKADSQRPSSRPYSRPGSLCSRRTCQRVCTPARIRIRGIASNALSTRLQVFRLLLVSVSFYGPASLHVCTHRNPRNRIECAFNVFTRLLLVLCKFASQFLLVSVSFYDPANLHVCSN